MAIPPNSIPDYWARKASELIGRTEADQRRIELRAFFEDRVFWYMDIHRDVRREAERKSFEDLQRVIFGEA